jgi:2-hydroxychromene-2-carboxylate isomerase
MPSLRFKKAGRVMGELILLSEHRRATGSVPTAPSAPRRRAQRATFWFDLTLPGTYLAAERVDRTFPGVRWEPAALEALHAGQPLTDRKELAHVMAEAETRAAVLRAPLVWPDRYPRDVRPAMRAASLACELGLGAPFVLAASRLAFCGGFDLGDPEVLAEAAAAANVPLDRCLAAAGDVSRDEAIEAAGRRLLALGADQLPVLRVGRRLFCGEERLPEATAAAYDLDAAAR